MDFYVNTNDNRIDNCQKFTDEKLNECFDFISSKVDSGFETIESKFGINKDQKVYKTIKDTIKDKIGYQGGLLKETEDMVVGISSMMEKYSPQMQIARVVDKTVDIYEDPEKYINGVKELYGKASYATSHPKETMDAVGETIKAVGSDLGKYFDEIKDDPYKRGMLKGRATMFVASMFVGGGEAKVASKAGKGEEVLKDVNKDRNIRIETEYEKLKARIYANIEESRKAREASRYSEFLKKEKAIIEQIETKARVNANVIESRKGTKVSRYQEFIKEEKKIIDNLRKTEGGTKADDFAKEPFLPEDYYTGATNNSTSLKFQPNCDSHITVGDGIARKGIPGVKGCHNMNNFFNEFTSRGWDLGECIESITPHLTIDGIYEIKYKIPAQGYGPNGEGLIEIPGKYKNIPKPKTVYDPVEFSDKQMIEYGKKAMQEGVNAGRISADGRTIIGYYNGIQFEGYIDLSTREVTNFFPTIRK